ncbi:MAG: hypothetical protein CMM87_02885 [Rickettsiales bacterium]|nr:hypothetical protein [Rickettsiales bacterium]
MSKCSTIIFFFSVLLILVSVKAEEEKQMDPSKQEMAEYKKHCLILVNLANTYGVLEGEQERLKKEKEKKKKEKEQRRSRGYYSSDDDDDDDDIDEDQEEKNRILEDDNSPLGVFKKLTQKPQGVPTLSRLEKSHLQAMAKNCEDLIEVIDQYEFDVISLKGHWKVLAENKSSNMKGLAKAFVTRQKSYDKIVNK